jgi:hypothetical protein
MVSMRKTARPSDKFLAPVIFLGFASKGLTL